MVLEQFFRPPYVPPLYIYMFRYCYSTLDDSIAGYKGSWKCIRIGRLTIKIDTRSSTHSRKVLSPPASVASTLSADIPLEKNDALPASSARPFVLPRPSPSKLKSVLMEVDELPDMILT